MCGIVGAIADRDVMPILMEGLRRLEYRGYDSAGVAIQSALGELQRFRALGKVAVLQAAVDNTDVTGNLGIAHTRWATHGVPAERNAHPQMSDVSGVSVAVVHNGIVENHNALRDQLLEWGYSFTSETDTEVIAHLLAHKLKVGKDLFSAVLEVSQDLTGAYAVSSMTILAP